MKSIKPKIVKWMLLNIDKWYEFAIGLKTQRRRWKADVTIGTTFPHKDFDKMIYANVEEIKRVCEYKPSNYKSDLSRIAYNNMKRLRFEPWFLQYEEWYNGQTDIKRSCAERAKLIYRRNS